MGGKAVLAHAGDPTELNDALLVESRLDHVPSHRTLASDKRSDTEEGQGGTRGEATAEEEVGDRGEEGEANHAAEDAVRPLPKVDRLEVLKGDVLVLSAKAGRVSLRRRKQDQRGKTHNRHSGVARYLLNSRSQSAAPMGGRMPLTTFHSVIESPLSVKRVMPPTTTIANTIAAMTARYLATSGVVRDASGGSGEEDSQETVAVERDRGEEDEVGGADEDRLARSELKGDAVSPDSRAMCTPFYEHVLAPLLLPIARQAPHLGKQ